MQPDEIEQMLYERAIRTKIRAPLPERLSNLGYNRVVSSLIVAAAALVCSLVMSKSTTAPTGNAMMDGNAQPQFTDNTAKRNSFHQQPADTDAVPASLAMSPVGG